MLILAASAVVLWCIVLALPWRPWGCIEQLEAEDDDASCAHEFTILIPARNEAAVIRETLRAVAAAVPHAPVIVIDDQSVDATADIACASGLENFTVISGTPPPANWTGKLWALQQGLERVATPRVLLLDADILLVPGMLSALQARPTQAAPWFPYARNRAGMALQRVGCCRRSYTSSSCCTPSRWPTAPARGSLRQRAA